jgi:hypothetical protein
MMRGQGVQQGSQTIPARLSSFLERGALNAKKSSKPGSPKPKIKDLKQNGSTVGPFQVDASIESHSLTLAAGSLSKGGLDLD